jgi:hypothetical protein
MNLVCSSCLRSFPMDRMHALPGWIDEPGSFVITFRCHACYPAAIDDTERRVAAWDDATAAGMASFVDLWDIRDHLPELADGTDRDLATGLVQVIRASDGKAMLPLVVPDPGAVEQTGFLERARILATGMPRLDLVRWSLWLAYLIFLGISVAPGPWRYAGWAVLAGTLLVPWLFEPVLRPLAAAPSKRGWGLTGVLIGMNVLMPQSVRAEPWFGVALIAVTGSVMGTLFCVYANSAFRTDQGGDEDAG